MAAPIASLMPLHFGNGSATYTSPSGDHSITGSVNGPVEVNRRDTQRPDEATLEIVVKGGVGATGVGERYVEDILRSAISRVILMRDKNLARKAIVVTLVVVKNTITGGKVDGRGGSYLPILPSLLHTALFALLSAAIPMSMIYTATLVAVSQSNEVILNPSVKDVKLASSLHALAFSSQGHLLLNESQGSFDMDTWDKVYDAAETMCRGSTRTSLTKDGDVSTGDMANDSSLEQFVRDTVEDKIREQLSWKLSSA